jgi:hypothetical protein
LSNFICGHEMSAYPEQLPERWLHACCSCCRYALRGLPDNRCPECGTAFDPTDPQRYVRPSPNGRCAKWLLRPTRWIAGSSRFVCIAIVLAQMFLFLPFVATLLLLLAAEILMAAPYLYWSTCRQWTWRSTLLFEQIQQIDLAARERIARNVLITTIIVATQLPLMIPFYISRPWLDRYANHIYRDRPMLFEQSAGQWCGLYYVSHAQSGPSQVDLFIGCMPASYYPDVPGQVLSGDFSGRWSVLKIELGEIELPPHLY